VRVGNRFSGRRHFADVIAEKDGKKTLVSLKWQQVGGTAEEKIPYEVMCLGHALDEKHCDKAYLVLGGEGWTLREFYTTGGLAPHLVNHSKVTITTLENFIFIVNKGRL